MSDGREGLLVHCHGGCDPRDVLAALRRVGLADRRPPEPTPKRTQPADAPTFDCLSDHGRRLWASCQPIKADDPAGNYLAARGCAMPHPDGDLRFHPALPHPPSGHVGPALVALVTDIKNAERWLTLHRTWIAEDGRKAVVTPPRLLLARHRKAGGCIRLWPDAKVTLGLGLAEGIETALTMARAFTPVWATLDAGNLGAFPYLYPIESVTVAVDHDPAGLAAFEKLAARWWAGATAAGIAPEVRKVVAPPQGDDLNDWIRKIDDAR